MAVSAISAPAQWNKSNSCVSRLRREGVLQPAPIDFQILNFTTLSVGILNYELNVQLNSDLSLWHREI